MTVPRNLDKSAVGSCAATESREREGNGLITVTTREVGSPCDFATFPASAGRTFPCRPQTCRGFGEPLATACSNV